MLGKMLRMDEHGFFQLMKVSNRAPDGAMRVCSISLLIETEFLRNKLGGWDSVKFSADSELLARAERLLGTDFIVTDTLCMLCLSHEASLSNHKIHGAEPLMGLSASRLEYQRAWREWHQGATEDELKLPFPIEYRPFKAPEAMLVPLHDVASVLAADN